MKSPANPLERRVRVTGGSEGGRDRRCGAKAANGLNPSRAACDCVNVALSGVMVRCGGSCWNNTGRLADSAVWHVFVSVHGARPFIGPGI